MGPHVKHKAVCLPLAGTGARGRDVDVSRSPRELAVRPASSLSYKMSPTLKAFFLFFCIRGSIP